MPIAKLIGGLTEVDSDAIVDGSIVDADINSAAAIDASKIANGSISNTEFQYLNGVTSSIQTQFAAKQPLDATLTALAALSTSADKFIYSTASDTFTTATVTSAARSILDDTSVAAIRTTLAVPSRLLHVGAVDNLGVTLASGTFTITQANGSSLSNSDGNRGYVCVPAVTAGQTVVLAATASTHQFTDFNHSTDSDLTGITFGITSGVTWAEDKPFYLYAINQNDTDSRLRFAISANPTLTKCPVGTYVGYRDNPPSTPSVNNMFFLTNSNPGSTWDNAPCVCIGSFIMQARDSTPDWEVITLTASDGIGQFNEHRLFNMPTGQMGATASKYLANDVGTAPTFASNDYKYKVEKSDICTIFVHLSGNTATDGATGGSLQLALPYGNAYTSTTVSNNFYIETAGEIWSSALGFVDTVSSLLTFFVQNDTAGVLETSGITGLTNDLFSDGNRTILGSIRYQAF